MQAFFSHTTSFTALYMLYTTRSNIIYDVFNLSEKRSQKKCRGLLPIVTKGQIISPLQNNVQIIYITHSKQCTGGCRKILKPNFRKTKQPFSSPGGGEILMGLIQSLILDPRKLV